MRKLNIKDWTLIALIIIAVASAAHAGINKVATQTALAIFFMVGTGSIIIYLKTRKWRLASSDIITALIIAMVLAPAEPLWRVAIVCLAAFVAKHLILFRKKNIFNPAALGLTAGLPFGANLAWWGSFSPLLTIVVGSALLIFYQGRWKMIASFIVSLEIFIAIHALITGASFVNETLLIIGSSFFFIFFMLTDPKTSPIFTKPIVIYAILVAAGTIAAHLWLPRTMFIGGLLITNAATPFLNQLRPRNPMMTPPKT